MIKWTNTYCINLDSRPDRWERVQKEASIIGIKPIRFSAIKMDRGHDGCTASHMAVLKLARDEGVFMVIEDDIKVLSDDPTGLISKAYSQLPSDWDMLYLGATLTKRVERYSDNLFKMGHAWTAHAIIYNNQNGVVDYILENINERKFDVFLAWVVQYKFNCYITFPMVVTQEAGYSDILKHYVDYSVIENNYYKYTAVRKYDNVAVVVITGDKYSKYWDAWYDGFKENFNIDVPVYFITETIRCPFPDIIDIDVGFKGVMNWTGGLRRGLLQIEKQNIFLVLEDCIFVENITKLFRVLYASFDLLQADSLRMCFRPTTSKADPTDIVVGGVPVCKLKQNSKYLVSYMPCIWKRDFLLKCTEHVESPWASELKGSKRIAELPHKIYDYMKPGWAVDASKKGVSTSEGIKLMEIAREKRKEDSSIS